MPDEERNWHKLSNHDDPTEVGIEAIELRKKIDEEESKPIPSPRPRALREEYAGLRLDAEHDRTGRVLKLAEPKIEACIWESPGKEYNTRMNIMSLRNAWLDGREQMIRARYRDPDTDIWDLVRRNWWSTSWRGRRGLAEGFVKIKALEFGDIGRIKRAKVIQEFRIWSVRLKWLKWL